MIVNMGQTKQLLEGVPDVNPAGAIHALFDASADQLARLLKTSLEIKNEEMNKANVGDSVNKTHANP